MPNAIEWKDVAGVIRWLDRAGVAWANREASAVASIVVPERTGPFPVNHPVYLYFLLQDIDGDPVTGAVIGEFSIVRIDNGTQVDPHGLFMTEIGSGWYYLGTAAAEGFTATDETHVVVDIEHTASGASEQMVFFCLFMAHDRYLLQ